MKKIQEYLIKGDATAAVDRLVEAVKSQPEQAEQVAEAMHGVLKTLYGQYLVRPVHEFTQQLEKIVSPEAMEVIVGDLKPKMDRTRYWYGELRPVRHERLLRDARAAVTRDEAAEAAKLARQFIAESRSPQEKQQLAKQLIQAMAGLVRDQKRAVQVVQAVAADPQSGPFEFDLIQAFGEALARESRSALKESEREWVQALNGCTVALIECLPLKNVVGEPTEEELDRFCEEMSALLRAGLGRGRLDDLYDALRLMMEFAPTDPSSLPSLVGVEPRAFLGLGPRAKLTSVRGLERLGENERLRRLVLELSKAETHRRRITTLAGAMGGLRQPDFVAFLVGALEEAPNGSRDEEVVIDALGRIGAPAGVQRVLQLLQQVMTAREGGKLKVLDGKDIKRARMLLTTLGRIGRAKGLDPVERNALVRRVIEIVGARDSQISFHAADQLFTLRLNELDRDSRVWAGRQALQSMFARDRGAEMTQAAASPLGFRQPMANLLIRLGQELLPEMLEGARAAAGTYGGGLQAFGEVMSRIGDERAVPLLEMMTRTALAHDDRSSTASVLTELVGDPASGTSRALTRDDVLHPLLYALEKTGGEPGRRLLLQFADQVQSGQVAPPGNEVASILTRMKREAGTLGSMESAPLEAEDTVTEEEFQAAMSAARPGLLKKPVKRIPGIAQLGRSKRTEGLRVLLECLGDKDGLVFNAAETALTQCVTPPPAPEKYEAFLMALFEDEKMVRGAALERLIEVVTRSFPKREPYSEIFRRSVGRYISDEVAAHRLKSCMNVGAAARAAGNGGAEGGNGEEPSAYESRMAEMDRKRDYLEKRRQWIASGKKGPAPEPPK